jgi:UDP-glucose 4-epimerase
MAILITGGTGFIGSHTSVMLLKAGYEIIVVDNLSNSKIECISRISQICGKKFKFYQNDVQDFKAMSKIFSSNNIEAVIHFAGLKSVGESVQKPLSYYENNIYNSLTLFKVMEKYNVKSLIFSSSATVYGKSPTMPCTEDMPIGGCTTPYAQTKFMIELMLKDLYNSGKGWNITILRYFNPIGANETGLIGEDPQGIPNNLMPFISQVAVGKLDILNVFGNDFDTIDGTGMRDYIHVEDLSRGHILALESQKIIKGLNIYNLGTGNATSVLQLVKAFETINNIKVPFKIVNRRSGDIAISYANVNKAKKDLNFETLHDINRMCRDSYRWQRQNPNGM